MSIIENECIKSAIKLLQSKNLHNSDIRAAISKLETALHIREAENTNTDLIARYDAYFDDMERANKKPLPFDQWRATNN